MDQFWKRIILQLLVACQMKIVTCSRAAFSYRFRQFPVQGGVHIRFTHYAFARAVPPSKHGVSRKASGRSGL